MRGLAGSDCERGRRVRGRGRRAGPAHGPHTCARRCKVGAVGLAGLRSRVAWAARPSSSFPFSVFFFFFLDLNSNLVLKFEFQFGAPNLLELLSIS